LFHEPPKYIQQIEFIWKIKQILGHFPQYFVPKDPKLPASKSNFTTAVNNLLKSFKIKISPSWHDACKLEFGPLRP
jgi:hypothetical protein